MLSLDAAQFGGEQVEVGVRDLRRIIGVVSLIVVGDEPTQLGHTLAEFGRQTIEDHGITTALPRTRPGSTES